MIVIQKRTVASFFLLRWHKIRTSIRVVVSCSVSAIFLYQVSSVSPREYRRRVPGNLTYLYRRTYLSAAAAAAAAARSTSGRIIVFTPNE